MSTDANTNLHSEERSLGKSQSASAGEDDTLKLPSVKASRYKMEKKQRDYSGMRHWFFYSVIIGLMPILFTALLSLGKPFDWLGFFSSGEFMVISLALSGEAIGEQILKKRIGKDIDSLIFAMCLCTFITSGVEFANVTVNPDFPKSPSIVVFLIIFFSTIVTGALSKIEVKDSLSEKKPSKTGKNVSSKVEVK